MVAESWRSNLVEDEAGVAEIVRSSRRIAVLGIKTEAQADQPAFYVARFLQQQGLSVVPVPVYYPEVRDILGQPVFRSLSRVPGPIDLVDVFRLPRDIPVHLDDIEQKRPRAVWFQLGIRNDAAAERLAKVGIRVVQDRCLMVDWRRYGTT
jgi:predicted CoA-binding protein